MKTQPYTATGGHAPLNSGGAYQKEINNKLTHMKTLYFCEDATQLRGKTSDNMCCTNTTERPAGLTRTVKNHNRALFLWLSFMLLILLPGIAWGQTTQNMYWNFNQSTCAGMTMTTSPANANLTGTYTYTGNCTVTTGIATTGTAFVSQTAGNTVRKAIANGDNTVYYWYFTLSGSDLPLLSDYQLYFQMRRSITGQTYTPTISYSINGGTYTGAQNISTGAANTWVAYNYTFSGITGVTSSLTFRIQWQQTGSGACNVDLDNFQVQGICTTPAQPSAISGNTTPCKGTTETYSVTNVAGVTYTWNLPSGWSGSSSTNSITATVGSGSGNITVTPSNDCGNGTARTFAVTVNNPPSATGVTICSGETSQALTASASCPSGSAANTGTVDAGTGANLTGVGNRAWNNTSRVTSNDNSYVSVDVVDENSSNYLKATNYGFEIPVGSTINGIQVNIGRYTEDGQSGRNRDNIVRLVKNDVISGDNKATSSLWPTSEGSATYGTSSDLWGTSWTYEDINSSNFGVVLSAYNTNTFAARMAYIDYMQRLYANYCLLHHPIW